MAASEQSGDNPEGKKQRAKGGFGQGMEYYHNKRDEILKQKKEYYQKNKDKRKEYQAQRYLKKKEEEYKKANGSLEGFKGIRKKTKKKED